MDRVKREDDREIITHAYNKQQDAINVMEALGKHELAEQVKDLLAIGYTMDSATITWIDGVVDACEVGMTGKQGIPIGMVG